MSTQSASMDTKQWSDGVCRRRWGTTRPEVELGRVLGADTRQPLVSTGRSQTRQERPLTCLSRSGALLAGQSRAPPAGFEPALPPPKAGKPQITRVLGVFLFRFPW